MVRLSFLSRALPGVAIERVIAELARSGYDGVELCAADARVERVAARAADNGLDVSGFHADLSAVNPLADPASPSYSDEFNRALEMCAQAGSSSIAINSGNPADALAAWDYFRALDRMATEWRHCAERAAKAGITVLWEFDPSLAYHRPSDVLNVHRRVDHPNFRILFNTAHAYLAARGTGGAPEFLRKVEDRVGGVHLADTDGGARRPLEEGIIDFRGLAPQLLDVKTDWWCADLRTCADVWQLIGPTREFMASLANSRSAA